MSQEEIDRMLRGEDFYFGTEEVERRWNNVLEAREKENSEAEQEHLKEHISILKQQLKSMKEQVVKKKTRKAST